MTANRAFSARFSAAGNLVDLRRRGDATGMSWVVDPEYLDRAGFAEDDKLFGEFDLMVGGVRRTSRDAVRDVRVGSDRVGSDRVDVRSDLGGLRVTTTYDLGSDPDGIELTFAVVSDADAVVEDLGLWVPFSHVMFRDADVRRNTEHSAAAFPSISPSFTRLAMHRRSGRGPHLGLFQTAGETLSVGTYCAYRNLFFEDVSPSLDGVLFHRLVLAGGYPGEDARPDDWIYRSDALRLTAGEEVRWSYRLRGYDDRADLARVGRELGHPDVEYSPMVPAGGAIELAVTAPPGRSVARAQVTHGEGGARTAPVTVPRATPDGVVHLRAVVHDPGEHVVRVELDDGSADQVVVNVVPPLARVIDARVRHISDVLYQGPDGPTPHAFSPVSNQGESLGKLNLVLAANLARDVDPAQVRRVEESAVRYVRAKWFTDGDLSRPAPLYGSFYRVMDLEYVAHLFYLLSRFDDDVLTIHPARTYLRWAADVLDLRVNPDRHTDERAKEETQMLGVYFLYVDDLLAAIRDAGMTDTYERVRARWEAVVDRVAADSATYRGAVTEHYYDNAGFGPSAGALAAAGRAEADRYAELLLANIGYSNDFRAQNPDRWWEALAPMIHALWGGVSAAAMLKVHDATGDPAHLEAAYRATVAVLYCYDSAATATALRLQPGEAASTYAVTGPHVNRPDLSRNRFGQATFHRDGGIFARLFSDGDQSPDWDMGEELVAYLDGFGRTTYLYDGPDGTPRVVNGSLTRTADGYVVESFAPYPHEFRYRDRGLHLVTPVATPRVVLTDDALIPEDGR
ncbi:hypothetical protein ACH436_11335 [Isoptericola sp. NPDC019693]|uniref:hypothetical protein n=1 Tax=Isoptericola sp. NPDC019693 TaxID=3364009 RepID=UPI0037B7C498